MIPLDLAAVHFVCIVLVILLLGAEEDDAHRPPRAVG